MPAAALKWKARWEKALLSKCTLNADGQNQAFESENTAAFV
jgi:hypothetical protein